MEVCSMSYLDEAVDISEMGQSNLWVIYGKSGSGKTHLISTFPKPLLYLQFGDDGSNTITNVEGIKGISVTSLKQLKEIAYELRLDNQYKTIVVDTFSLVVQEWIDANAVKKNKRVSQQMWGDVKTDTEELIKEFKIVATSHIVALTCHEATDTIEGMEEEITPDVRPSVSKGARTYLESMANYGIHTTVLSKEKDNGDGTTTVIYAHAAHLGANPYYWTKLQKPAEIKVPKQIVNPTYGKITKIMKGEK
jgi:hypothetical protein